VAKAPRSRKIKRRSSVEDDLLNKLLRQKIVEQRGFLQNPVKFAPQSTFGQLGENMMLI